MLNVDLGVLFSAIHLSINLCPPNERTRDQGKTGPNLMKAKPRRQCSGGNTSFLGGSLCNNKILGGPICTKYIVFSVPC